MSSLDLPTINCESCDQWVPALFRDKYGSQVCNRCYTNSQS